MKVATCNFCRRSFRKTQAVRAHLKACAAYRRLPKATLPRVDNKPRTIGAADSDPGVPPWEDVPQPMPPRPQPARIVAGTGQKGNLSGLARWTIQSVKDTVIGSWWSPGHTIPSETKAQALVAIDEELSRLPVDQLPRTELVTIAEGIRDRIYRPVIQAQQRAREGEERRRQQARQRTTLIAAGVTYANQALRQQHALESWTRLDLEQKVKRAVEQAVDGSESEADLRALVDRLLAQLLEPLARERRDTARPRLIAHGVAYLRLQLAPEDDLDARERLSIERDVKRDLEDGVTGEESTGDWKPLLTRSWTTGLARRKRRTTRKSGTTRVKKEMKKARKTKRTKRIDSVPHRLGGLRTPRPVLLVQIGGWICRMLHGADRSLD